MDCSMDKLHPHTLNFHGWSKRESNFIAKVFLIPSTDSTSFTTNHKL